MKLCKAACLLGLIALIAPINGALRAKSRLVMDKTAGMNGGFEAVQSGLPVNWMFYTPKTGAAGDFDILTDQKEFKEGKQSLKFLVRECSDKGGWRSPGFIQQFKAAPGETYAISFWTRNDGCEFIARAGGVSAFHGQSRIIARSAERADSWRQFTAAVVIPKNMDALRWELNILKPGTFWIDDLKIEKIAAVENPR